ncbi:MAG: replication initiation protein [Campylobacterales bacterium]
MKQISKFINARYRLDKDEVLFIVSLLENNKDENGTFFVNIEKFAKRDVFIKNLIKKNMELQTDNGYLLFNFFTKIEYKKENNIVFIDIQKNVEEFLLELKNSFSKNELILFLSLSNNYTRGIYKILITYKNKKEIIVNLKDLMDSLNVPKSLFVYADFKRKVLNPVQIELAKEANLFFSIKEKKDARKVTSLVFHINSKEIIKSKKLQNEQKMLTKEVKESKAVDAKQNTKLIRKDADDEFNDEIKRIVSFFDHERKKLQPNYVRKESSYNMSGEYLLRVHLKETGRTPQMFFDAIRWLFSNNPQASFHRQYIMNIGKLIEHFNTLEHQAMYSKEAVEFNEEAKVWYNIYKKQGLSHEEILEKLKEGEYI